MSQPSFNTVALTGNPDDRLVCESLRLLAGHLQARGKPVVAAAELAASGLGAGVRHLADPELARSADLMIVVGGDGSMLYAARRVAGTAVPLLGINRGRLGFLADVGPHDMLQRIDEVLQGEYATENRLMLRADIIEGGRVVAGGTALNDIVVARHDPGRMLEIRTFIDGHYVNTHGGDGFIVATATGSTAYALSCGGPIVAPALGAILLVPICPHTLSERPILVPATTVAEIMLSEPHSERADVSCDGEVAGDLRPGRTLRVQAADHGVVLVHPRGYDYFEILREKLHWGRDYHGRPGTSQRQGHRS